MLAVRSRPSLIAHTNHIFTTGSGMTQAVQAVEKWLPMHFPVVQPVDDATSEATSVSSSPA